jgi:SAM-dependent methyltransferase
MEVKDKEQLCGQVYSDLWEHFQGNLFDKYTYDLWYKSNRYDQWLDPEIKGKVCLDAGFGSGRAMAAMLGAGANKVYGIDISPKNAATAQANLARYQDQIDITTGSVLHMPYEDETFDVVHCYGVLHHTSDPYKGFTECCRVLKKGGVLFVALYCKGGLVNNTLDFFRLLTTRGIPPVKMMTKISRSLFGEDEGHLWYALLDGLYAPYRETYTELELRKWCNNNSIKEVVRYYCTWFYYKWTPFFSGKDRGLIILKGYKY